MHKNIKTLCLAVVLGAFGLVGDSHAQERTAGSALDTQMTWTALSNMAKAASDKADGVNARVDQAVVCGRLGKIYAPGGGAGVDSLGCKDAAVDFTTILNQLTALDQRLTNVMVCSAKKMNYAPSAPGRDAQGCVAADEVGGMKVGNYTTSINGSRGYTYNTDYVAPTDLFIAASSYGGGGESCPVSARVGDSDVAHDYAIRYTSGISFMVPKGQRWRVIAVGGNCGNRQVLISSLPLN